MFFKLFALFYDLIESFNKILLVYRFKYKKWPFYARLKVYLRLETSFWYSVNWRIWPIIWLFGDILWLWIWWCLNWWGFDWILKIISEWVFDIGIKDGSERLLIISILGFDDNIIDLENPSHKSKILEVVIIEILIDSVIFAEIVGFF